MAFEVIVAGTSWIGGKRKIFFALHITLALCFPGLFTLGGSSSSRLQWGIGDDATDRGFFKSSCTLISHFLDGLHN